MKLEKIKKSRIVVDRRYRSITFAVFSLIFDLIYTFYNGALGIVTKSIWFSTSCVYYLLLCAMRFCALLLEKKRSVKAQYSFKTFVGALLSILSIVLMVIVYLSLSQNIATKYGEITMITIATYTFTKIIMAIIKAVKYRHQNSPLMSIIQNIRYAEIAVSVLTMQRSMLVSFGNMEPYNALILNAFTGAGVTFFTLFLGIYMIKNNKKGKNYG